MGDNINKNLCSGIGMFHLPHYMEIIEINTDHEDNNSIHKRPRWDKTHFSVPNTRVGMEKELSIGFYKELGIGGLSEPCCVYQIPNSKEQ